MNNCKACGSSHVLTRGQLAPQSMGSGRHVMLSVPGGDHCVPVEVSACADCGHIWLHASDLNVLRAAYERISNGGLNL